MSKPKVLIVEDELIIASYIETCLEDYGFESAGIAVSFDEAIHILQTEEVAIALLDINLSGSKTGIDIANEINKNYQIPFVFLTSYSDAVTIEELQKTFPKGYLSKPINETNLTTTLSIVLNNTFVQLTTGRKRLAINLANLLYIKTDHVYIHLFFTDKEEIVRMSMSAILEQFPVNSLLQVNRSVAINPKKIIKKESSKLYLESNLEFKISEKFLENFD